MVDEVTNIYNNLREIIDEDFDKIYEQAVRMAAQGLVFLFGFPP